MIPDEIDDQTAVRYAVKLFGVIALLCVLGLGIGALTGCAVFQPQADIATLCTKLTDRNAGMTCVKAGYASVKDGSNLVMRRYHTGQLSLAAAASALDAFEQTYAILGAAELALSVGDLRGAEGQLNAAIALLNALETRL